MCFVFIGGKTKNVKERMGWAIEVIKHPVLALQLLALGLGGSPCFFFRTVLVAEWLKARHSLFLCLFIWEMQFLFEAFKVWAFLQMGKNGRKKKPSAKIVYTRMLWIISNLEFFFFQTALTNQLFRFAVGCGRGLIQRSGHHHETTLLLVIFSVLPSWFSSILIAAFQVRSRTLL